MKQPKTLSTNPRPLCKGRSDLHFSCGPLQTNGCGLYYSHWQLQCGSLRSDFKTSNVFDFLPVGHCKQAGIFMIDGVTDLLPWEHCKAQVVWFSSHANFSVFKSLRTIPSFKQKSTPNHVHRSPWPSTSTNPFRKNTRRSGTLHFPPPSPQT